MLFCVLRAKIESEDAQAKAVLSATDTPLINLKKLLRQIEQVRVRTCASFDSTDFGACARLCVCVREFRAP